MENDQHSPTELEPSTRELIESAREYLQTNYRLITALFVGSFALFLAIGGNIDKRYPFVTSIEIGNTLEGGALKPLESPENLKAKIEHSIIPSLLGDIAETEQIQVTARIPLRSEIVALESRGTSQAFEQHRAFHQAVVEKSTGES